MVLEEVVAAAEFEDPYSPEAVPGPRGVPFYLHSLLGRLDSILQMSRYFSLKCLEH